MSNKILRTEQFNRSVCFTFFESYLEQAKEVKEIMGADKAYDYLEGLIEYALYERMPDDATTKMLVTGLKNTIDANQKKRASGFSRENIKQTEAINKYKEENPDATQRAIADALNCSLGKVNKSLRSNPNPNCNDNPNLNTVNVNMNTSCNDSLDLTAVVRKGKRKIEELEIEELESLEQDLKAGKAAGRTYPILYKEYGLEDGVLSVNTLREIRALKKAREESRAVREKATLKARINETFAMYPEKKQLLLDYTGIEGEEAERFFANIEMLGKDVDELLFFFEEYSGKEDGYFTYQKYCSEFLNCADSYLGLIKNIIDTNGY